MSTVFQVTAEDIERHDLDADDLDKWCIVVKGTIQGYKDTREQAEELERYINTTD